MHSSINKILRFETFAGASMIALLFVVANQLVPYAEKVIRHGAGLYGFWNVTERTADCAQRKTVVHKENRLLDSIIKIHERNVYTDENSVAATLYERADSSGIKTSKIEIGEKQMVDGRFQAPVSVQGIGAYAALGNFCEAVENLPAPARLRLVSAETAGNGAVKMFVDFVLLSDEPGKGN
jgi:hypothetical protein